MNKLFKKIGLYEISTSLFLSITVGIIIPSTLFLYNVNEFSITYTQALPVFFLMFLICFVVCFLLLLLTSFNRRIMLIVFALIFALALSCYVQGNFLNSALGTLNGRDAPIQINSISNIVWIIIILISLIMIIIFNDKTKKVMAYISYFLCIVQIISLLVLVFTTKRTYSNEYAFDKSNEFTLSNNNNIVVFVVDTLDARWFEEFFYDSKEELGKKYKEELDDFVYFDDVVSQGAPTKIGIPTLLTGETFDPYVESYEEYFVRAYQNLDLFKDLKDNKYTINIFSDINLFHETIFEYLDNISQVKYKISDTATFLDKYSKFVAYYVSPQLLKENFLIYSSDLTNLVSTDDSEIFLIDDAQLYADFQNSNTLKISNSNEGTFVIYHLAGSHGPYNLNENAERVDEKDSSRVKQTYGCFKYITEYLAKMKEIGIYDDSTIIITADHGALDVFQNPAVLVKKKNMHDGLSKSSVTAVFNNLRATIAEAFLDDYSKYGLSLFDDIPYVETRLHAADHGLRENIFPDDPSTGKQYDYYAIGSPSRETEKITDAEVMAVLNANKTYTLFGEDANAGFVLTGFSKVEANNRWLDRKEAKINFDMINPEEDYVLTLNINNHFYCDQNVNIFVDDVLVNTILVNENKTYEIEISKQFLNNDRIVLRFEMPDAISPKEVSGAGDSRLLSISIQQLSLNKK